MKGKDRNEKSGAPNPHAEWTSRTNCDQSTKENTNAMHGIWTNIVTWILTDVFEVRKCTFGRLVRLGMVRCYHHDGVFPTTSFGVGGDVPMRDLFPYLKWMSAERRWFRVQMYKQHLVEEQIITNIPFH